MERAKTRTAFVAGSCVGLCAVAAFAASSLPSAWQHWRYSRPIEVEATDRTRLVNIALPQDVYLHAENSLADVRVIDDGGNEVPYAPDVWHVYDQPRIYPAQIIENSFSPGHYTQLVLDTGVTPGFHDAVEIEVGEDEFMEWVQVEASDDAQVWRIVQERAPIFRFAREGHQGTRRIGFSENNSRYLRIRILDGTRQFPVRAVTIIQKPAAPPPERVALAMELEPTKPDVPHASAWLADLGKPMVPIREVRFEVGPGEFVREVRVETSRDKSIWSSIGTGEIFRLNQDDYKCEQLSVSVGGMLRYVRVEILNGNDAPLHATPKFYVTPERLVFEQEPGKNYRLIYGHREAPPPVYDLRRRISFVQMSAAATAQTGAEEINAAWRDPRPWTESHEYVVWFGVTVAILLLAYSAVSSLKRAKPSTKSTGQ
jgi:Protein of unknown function (DUF3999)